jgi:hypothetical protein
VKKFLPKKNITSQSKKKPSLPPIPEHLKESHWRKKLEHLLKIAIDPRLSRETPDDYLHLVRRVAALAVGVRLDSKTPGSRKKGQPRADYVGNAFIDLVRETGDANVDRVFKHFGEALRSSLKRSNRQRPLIYRFLIDNWKEAEAFESEAALLRWAVSQPQITTAPSPLTDDNFYAVLRHIGLKLGNRYPTRVRHSFSLR